MKRISLIHISFGLLYLILCSSCGKGAVTNNKQSMAAVMGNQSLILSESEIHDLEAQALNGVPDPALRLHLFYEYVRRDRREAFYWVQIAAENGHPIGEYNFGSMLLEDSDQRNRQRAKFWLERAAKRGDKDAEELLKTIP